MKRRGIHQKISHNQTNCMIRFHATAGKTKQKTCSDRGARSPKYKSLINSSQVFSFDSLTLYISLPPQTIFDQLPGSSLKQTTHQPTTNHYFSHVGSCNPGQFVTLRTEPNQHSTRETEVVVKPARTDTVGVLTSPPPPSPPTQ